MRESRAGRGVPTGGQTAAAGHGGPKSTRHEARVRHTKGKAIEAVRALGSDEDLGAFIHRVRAAGLDETRVGHLLGFPEQMDADSVRRTLVRWERAAGLATKIDSTARANVVHARNRLIEAIGHLPIAADASDAEIERVTLDEALEGDAAQCVRDFLQALLAFRDAEVAANLLGVPRDVMPGARPVSWVEIEARIDQLEANLKREQSRKTIASFIARERRRQRVAVELERHPQAREILARLDGHQHADEILAMLNDKPETPSASDVLSRLTIEFTPDIAEALDAAQASDVAEASDIATAIRNVDLPEHRARLWPAREDVTERKSRRGLLLCQRIGDRDIAAIPRAPAPGIPLAR
jgi:hypothetical protein